LDTQNSNPNKEDNNTEYDKEYFRKPFLETYIKTEVKELKKRVYDLMTENEALKEENKSLKEDQRHLAELIERWKTQAELWKKRYDDILDIRKFEEHTMLSDMKTKSKSTYTQPSTYTPNSYSTPSYEIPSYQSNISLQDEILGRIKDILKPYGQRGLLQADVQRMLSNYDRRRIGESISMGLENGDLVKLKEGRTFRVILKSEETKENDTDTDNNMQLPGTI